MRKLFFILVFSLSAAAIAGADEAEDLAKRCPSLPLDLAKEMKAPDTPPAIYLGWIQVSKHRGPARTLLAAKEVCAALACEKKQDISDAELLKALHWAGMDAASYPQPDTQSDVMSVLDVVAQSTSAYDSTIYPYLLSCLHDDDKMVRVSAAGLLILYRENPEAVESVASLLDNRFTRTQGLNALVIIFNDPWVPLESGRPVVERVRRALFSKDSEDDRSLAANVLGKLAGQATAAINDLENVRDSDKSDEVRQYAAEALRNILHPEKYQEERAARRQKHPARRRPS